MRPPSIISQVDSDRFGVVVGRAFASGEYPVEHILADCQAQSVKMLILRCKTEDTASVHAFEKRGARLMDTLVYYKRSLRKGELPAELKPNVIRPVVDADLSELGPLVQQTFSGYRGHYHADELLDPAKCDEGYAEWALKMCINRDANTDVLIGEHPAGVVAGFATLRMNSPEEGEGVLFGVHPCAQGRGMYWSFMVKALEWCGQRGASRMVVSTQITNLSVQKVWTRMGFELFSSYYTFHLWF